MEQSPYISTSSGAATKNISHYTQTLTYLLGELKHVFDKRDDPETTRVAAYERLAEISKIMRAILEKYSLLKSKELLINASNLVQAVKSYDYQNYSIESHSKLVDSINALYRSFQFNISNCLMQDVVTMASAQSIDLPSQPSNDGQNSDSRMQQQQQSKIQSRQLPTMIAEEQIFSYESGLDELLKQAKACSKYIKEIVNFIEKRAQIESDYNRNILKNAQNLRNSIHHLKNDNVCEDQTTSNQLFNNVLSKQAFLPFNNVYNQFCQNEIKNASICEDNFNLLIKNILNPVNEFRIDFEKQIKKIKEDWAKENKQLNDAVSNFSKSREIYLSKLQESEKIKPKSSEGSHDLWNEKMDPRAAEAEANCNKYILAMNYQKELFKKNKRDLIIQLENALAIIEIKIKEITSHYFETLKDSITYSPDDIQKAINDTNSHETGKAYRDFANSLAFNYAQHPPQSQSSSSSQNHSMIVSSSSQDNPEVDSSESDNNNQSFNLINKRKDGKSPMMNLGPKHSQQLVHENFSRKTIEKKYKSCYGHYTMKPIPLTQGKPKHFLGVPLCKLSSNAVPDIVKQCIKQIEQRGLRSNGIYRVSAVKSQVDNLCQSYESSSGHLDLSSFSPNVIASFLKLFFRMLPEPLLTFQLYPELIEVATKYSKENYSKQNEDEIIDRLKNIVRRLPPVNYNTLKYLMRHLKQISDNSSYNQMNPTNLAIVFAPNLLKKSEDILLLCDTNHQSRIVELLIIYSDQIFDSESVGDSSGLNRTNSFGSIDKSKNEMNGENNNHRTPHLLKSATCSTLRPEVSQSKQDMNQARLKFFASSVQPQQNPRNFYPYSSVNDSSSKVLNKNDGTIMSPFSQISAAASSSNLATSNYHSQQNRVKRITSIGHPLISNQSQNETKSNNSNKIYSKHNELSKSSSDIYSYKNINISITPNTEDHV